MIIQDGKVVFAKGYGLANVEEKIPCGTNTNFRLASVTKQFTAMSVLILAERKQLSLDERLTDFFPEFPAYGRQITVRHLLTHTSGLLDYEDLIPKGTEIPVLDRDVLRLLMQQDKTYFPPGTKYRYSNSALLPAGADRRGPLRQHLRPLPAREHLPAAQDEPHAGLRAGPVGRAQPRLRLLARRQAASSAPTRA